MKCYITTKLGHLQTPCHLLLYQRLLNQTASISPTQPPPLNPTVTQHQIPTGLDLSPLLYPLDTYDCLINHRTNIIVKYADDTNVVGLISDEDDTAFREEVENVSCWCSKNNLKLSS